MKRIALLLTTLMALSTALSAQSKPTATFDKSGLTVQGDKETKLNISNTYTINAASFFPTFDTSLATTGDQPFALTPALKFTNLQTKLSGSFSKKWGYEFHINYANNKIKMLNMLLDYRLNKDLKLRMGQMKVPGPMSENYSTSKAMKLTTPMGLSMASGRRFGIGLFHTTGRHYLSVGAYTINLNDYVGVGLPKQPEIGVAGRFTYNVINKRHEKLLLGSNIYFMRMTNGKMETTGNFGIETSASSARFLYYNHPATKAQLNYGVEMAYQNRNLLITLEGLGTNFFRTEELSTPQYAGWEARVSYTVLGKPRGYSKSSGDFSGSPYDGKKALELGIRSTGIYLNDKQGTEALAGYSFGAFANYWTTNHLCFSLHANYLNHHKDFHSNYHITNSDAFKGLDFVALQGQVTIIF